MAVQAPSTAGRRGPWLDLFCLICLGVAIALLLVYYQQTQATISKAGGAGWDGVHYLRLAEQMLNGEELRGVQPVVYRVGTPAVAVGVMRLGWAGDLIEAFRSANLAFGVLNVVLVFGLIRCFAGRWWALLGGVLYAMHWVSPLRYVFLFPVISDPGGLFFLYLGFLIMARQWTWPPAVPVLLALCTFVGLWFREFVMLLPLVLAASRTPWQLWQRRDWAEIRRAAAPAALPLLAGIVALLLVRLSVVIETDGAESYARYSMVRALLFHFWTNSPLFYLQAMFACFGLALVFLALRAQQSWRYMTQTPLLMACTILLLALAYVGGADIERYIIWTSPFMAVLVAKAVEQERPPAAILVGLVIFTVVFVCRLPWPLPDYRPELQSPFPIFTFIGSDFRLQDLYVLHSDKQASGKIFYQYLLASGMLALLLRRKWAMRQCRQLVGGWRRAVRRNP